MTRILTACVPLVFVPFVAWSRDVAVVVLVLGAFTILLSGPLSIKKGAIKSMREPWALAVMTLIIWSLAAVFWAPHLPFLPWLKVFLSLSAILVLAAGLIHLPTITLGRIAIPVFVSVLALFCLLLFERLTGGLLIRIERDSDTLVQILDALSGGLVMLSCMSFPTAWLLWRWTGRWIWSLAFVACCILLSLSYRMDAIPVGLFIGSLSALIVLKWHIRGFISVIGTVGIIALSWIPLVIGASALHLDSWLMDNIDRNWGYRIIIWHYVGELLRDHILVGYGFDSARVLGSTADLLPDRAGNSTFLHPHNGILQIWLELGLIGLIFLATTVIIIIRRIVSCAPSAGAMAAATGTILFSSTLWLLSYGIWQAWWIAVLGLAACMLILIFRIDANERAPS